MPSMLHLFHSQRGTLLRAVLPKKPQEKLVYISLEKMIKIEILSREFSTKVLFSMRISLWVFHLKGKRMNEEIRLRTVTIHDAKMLLEWRNDPETRKASHNKNEVQIDDHIAWLSHILNNPSRKLYVAEENDSPVGTIRADFSGNAWELSWTVSPRARGRSVGKRMVALLAKQISEPIRAEVKKGNISSTRIAEHSGMMFEREKDGVLHYRRAALE